MKEFILLFFPTVISLYIIRTRENKNYKDVLFLYPIYNIVINVVSFATLYFIKNRQIIYFSDNINRVDFCFKFLILSSIVALIIPYVKEFLLNNIQIEIETIIRKKQNGKKK